MRNLKSSGHRYLTHPNFQIRKDIASSSRCLRQEHPSLFLRLTEHVYVVSQQFGKLMHELSIPARGDNFPDVLLTVDVLLPSSNVDIYCRPGPGNPRRTALVPFDYDYKWKSGLS